MTADLSNKPPPTFTCSVLLPAPWTEVFGFFSDARNLERLTPPWLSFEVLTPEPIEMRAGTWIDYKLRIRGIPIRWQSEITAWEPPHRFVDTQRRGPYKRWVHEHLFEDRDGQTLATDRVEYTVYGGWFVRKLLVDRDVKKIFAFRGQALRAVFGTASDGSAPSPPASLHHD